MANYITRITRITRICTRITFSLTNARVRKYNTILVNK